MPDEGAARIVVGVDGSPGADEALRWAVAEASRRGALLHLVVASWYSLWIGGALLPIVVDELAKSARSLLATAVVKAEKLGSGVPIRPEVVNEPPAWALIDASEGAAMLVVGSGGRNAFGGFILGSVSQQCALNARCPVVVVPSKPREHAVGA